MGGDAGGHRERGELGKQGGLGDGLFLDASVLLGFVLGG